MEAPYNSHENSDEEGRPFEFEASVLNSPRLLTRAVLKLPKGPQSVMDSTSTFPYMKELNSSARFDRLTRPRTTLNYI